MAAPHFDLPQGCQGGVCAGQARHHVGEREVGQTRFTARRAMLMRKAAETFDETPEASQFSIGTTLAPAREAHSDQLWVFRMELLGRKTHGFQGPGAKALDQHLCGTNQLSQPVHRFRVSEIQGEASLVAPIDPPPAIEAFGMVGMCLPPFAQGVTASGRFQLDDVGTEIGELQGQHVARNQAGQIDHTHALQRTAWSGVGGDVWQVFKIHETS